MKLKRTAIIGSVVALALAVGLLVSMMIMPAIAAGTTYANNTFEGNSIGRYPSTYAAAPSLANVVDYGGNHVIKLDTVPGTAAGTTCKEFVRYPGNTIYEVSNGAVTIGGTSYTVTDGKVKVGDKEYLTSTDTRIKEMMYGGSNVDKNTVVASSEVSYTTANKIYLQAEYYISKDAKWTVQSQFINAKSGDAAANWLDLYTLDLTNATLRGPAGSTGSAPGSLNKGAWNTITMVLDLDSGAAEYYINNVYSFSATLKTNLTLTANKWNIAKLNKNSNAEISDFGGYVMIDNAKIATFQDSYVKTPSATDANGNKLAYLEVVSSVGAKVCAPFENTATKIIDTGDSTVTPVYFNPESYAGLLAPVKGASIRLTNAAGIRFATQINLDMMEEVLALKEAGLVSNVSIGTLITPKSYVTAAGAFTKDALDTKLTFSGSKYLDVKGTIGAYYGKLSGVALDSGFDTCFVGSITNVKLGNRDKDFSAVGYVRVDLYSGESAYIYSYKYNSSTIANYSRNVKGIALSALGDQSAAWTEAQKLVLTSFANGATTLSLGSSSVIKDVQYTSNEFYFRNAAGVYCRLTYEGVNGWRLQANGSSYDGFDETGAGQALALYLGEKVLDKTEHLTVTTDGSTVKIAAENTSTYVKLNYTGSFNMQFYTGKGSAVSNVNSIAVNNTATSTSTAQVSIKGTLAANEAVYGGGERFDVVNRRGTSINLYTQDGWNKAGTSYMAIPLFTTSRGAGMFVNRYENMTADFGATSSNVWDITISNEMIDCYFYATGRMTDALLGYTEISGHSSLPEEWAQGELICRYSPDMNNFEDNLQYTQKYASVDALYGSDSTTYGVKSKTYSSYKDIPNYTSYYVKGKISGSPTKLTSSTSSTLYNLNTLYKDSAATISVYTKSNGSYIGWATLAEAKAIGTQYFDYEYLFPLKITDGVVTGMTMTSYARAYHKEADGTYRKLGPKGNIGGDGVKTIVNNLINAGMKPTAMVMEPFGWGNISTNTTKYNELKNTVAWLQERDIKAMFYMGVGAISNNMAGYKPEYRVWATLTYTDGSVVKTDQIPKTSGTGTNPDVGTSAVQTYIDVTNPEAMDWYLNDIWGMMIDLGADGIKIDFCECMPDEGSYTSFDLAYNFYDDSVFDGDDVHHGYSTYFISIFYKSMLEQKAAKNIPDGFTVLSRGGGIGSQRNPYLWEGDQARTFEKIEDQLIALINSGISGVPFMTYDMAGYAYEGSGDRTTGVMSLEKESEIFARAIEYTAFTSNIQTHGDVRHAYEMNATTQEIYRNFTDLHEQLIPYIQKYSAVACETGMPVVRAMVLQYQSDANVYNLETQYMFGDTLLVAAITEEGATSKQVYLPEGNWRNLLTGETVTGGKTITVNASISQIPVFMNVDCTPEDQNLLADVFNGETWKKINGGVELDIEKLNIKGDPWLDDPFLE